MNDKLPTVWDAEPHTLAKHGILKKYLQAWMAILARQSALIPKGSKSILYVDGFAGPGVYKGGEEGSPIVAIRTAVDHTGNLPVPVRFLFVELEPARFQSLQQQLAKLQPMIQASKQVASAEARRGDCTEVLSAIVDNPNQFGGNFGPAMVFLDQFGYSQVPINLVAKIMAWDQCEVLSYLNWDHLNRYLSDPSKAAGITGAFGTEDWKQAIQMPGDQRRTFLLQLYRDALITKGGSKYVLDFAMYGRNDSLLYWLFFSTNHIRGLEEMKKAMWSMDESGGFRFSDHDHPGQLLLLKGLDDAWLADELTRRLAGRTLTVEDVRIFVLTETPHYLFKGALRRLEMDSKVVQPVSPRVGRKPGTYPEDDLGMKLCFAGPGLFSE
jgi:three-Cys-motif partner protein